MTYETAQLVESGNEEGLEQVATPTQRARPWRRMGLALAATSAIGVVMGTMTLRSRPILPVEPLQRLHSGILKAFSARSLAEAADMKARFDFMFAAEGQEDPDAMSIEAVVQKSESDVDHLQIKAVFAAKEGKGEDLVAQFQKILDGAKKYLDTWHGEGAGDMISHIVQVEAGAEDEAVVIVTPPPPRNEEEAEGELETAMESPPKFTASLSTGRTISEMHANIGDSCALLPHGVKGHVDAAFAHTLFKAAEDQMGMGHSRRPHRGPDPILMMGAMSSVTVNHEYRYRAGDPPPEAFSSLPSLKDGLEMFAANLASVPKAILDPVAGLADFADGLKSAEIRGLPQKLEVLLTCKNVHVTPLLKDLIEDLGEAEGEAAAEDTGVDE